MPLTQNTDSPGAKALAQILEDAVLTHPGSDGETISALAMVVALAIGSFPPVERPFALKTFFETVRGFLEVTP